MSDIVCISPIDGSEVARRTPATRLAPYARSLRTPET